MFKKFLALGLVISCSVFANKYDNVTISSEPVTDNIYMLKGAGGNIGVIKDGQSLLLVDDQFEPLAEKIKAHLLASLKASDVDYLINTHFHGDHTGGNIVFGKDGTILAHDNVRERLLQKFDSKSPALPVITYDQGVKVHFSGETINVVHKPAGHTDGDSIVFFEESNVVHAGDLFFEGRFPYIDLNNGGTVDGFISNVAFIFDQTDSNTRIIPGHGDLTNRAALGQYLTMMRETAAFIKAEKAKGKDLPSLIDQGLPDKWKSWSWSFITEEKWITTLYRGQ